jgi:hypothetical protein
VYGSEPVISCAVRIELDLKIEYAIYIPIQKPGARILKRDPAIQAIDNPQRKWCIAFYSLY